MRNVYFLALATLSLLPSNADAQWPQAAGPGGDFRVRESAPARWSVVGDQNIAWTRTLPETGQSTPVVCKGRVFFTTNHPVEKDAELGKDVVAWCVDAATGEVIWKREIKGKYPLRLSGCFGDSSSPPAVCDGERVVFTSSSGAIVCFDMQGETLWSRDLLTVNRTLPFLIDKHLFLTRQSYPPEPNGVFPHKYADSPKEMWTQLHAIDITTGKDVMTTECGVNMGCAILPQTLSDGRDVAVVGRGGGHGPPEKPDGISLVDLSDASTIWTLPLDGFMATMSYRIRDDLVHIFHRGAHLSIDAKSGTVAKRVSIVDKVPVRGRDGDGWVDRTESIPVGKNKRMITQTSNLLIGPWHYFRGYTTPWIGRVNVDSGEVEYLELPLQLVRSEGASDQLQWFVEPKRKGDPALKNQAIVENQMINSRGLVVVGDQRSRGNGWGHVAAPTPSVAGDNLYVPVQNGTVYVIDWGAKKLDEKAIVSINDLGPAGQSYTRASLSFADGRVFAHTIRELICIGN